MRIVDTTKINESQEYEIGRLIALMCGVKSTIEQGREPRYQLANGYAEKTAIGLARCVFDIINAQTEQECERIDWTRINNDACGNPRYVCHFLALLTQAEKDKISDVGAKYAIAIKRANKIGGRKFHNKRYGGGIVFQCYDPFNEIEPYIEQAIKDAQK